jgi:hypothetical protein
VRERVRGSGRGGGRECKIVNGSECSGKKCILGQLLILCLQKPLKKVYICTIQNQDKLGIIIKNKTKQNKQNKTKQNKTKQNKNKTNQKTNKKTKKISEGCYKQNQSDWRKNSESRKRQKKWREVRREGGKSKDTLLKHLKLRVLFMGFLVTRTRMQWILPIQFIVCESQQHH